MQPVARVRDEERPRGADHEPAAAGGRHIGEPSRPILLRGTAAVVDLESYSSSAARAGTRAAIRVGSAETTSEARKTSTSTCKGRQLAPRLLTGNPVVLVR